MRAFLVVSSSSRDLLVAASSLTALVLPDRPRPSTGKKLIVIDPEKVANNAKVNGVVFQFLAIVAGIVCGCLGLTDLKGFAAFGLANVAIGGAVVAKCGFKPSKYFIGIDKVVVDGASLGFGTFVLFWTLFYNICHLF